MAGEKVERLVGILEGVELDVGLVEDHGHVARDGLEELVYRTGGSAVAVGLFGLQTITIRVAAVTSAAMASRSCLLGVVQGHLDRAGAGIAARCG